MATNEFAGLFKYKDEEGNINVIMPVTNINNVNGMDKIETALSETVRFTEQTLTEEQKAQARANIGVIEVPSYTNDDEGKILRVVSGAATWTTVYNAEGESF